MAEHKCEKTEEIKDEEAQVQEVDAKDKKFAQEVGQKLVLRVAQPKGRALAG